VHPIRLRSFSHSLAPNLLHMLRRFHVMGERVRRAATGRFSATGDSGPQAVLSPEEKRSLRAEKEKTAYAP